MGAVTAKNKICILDIDVQGVQSVKKAELEPSPIFIFVNPPSMEALESRLRGGLAFLPSLYSPSPCFGQGAFLHLTRRRPASPPTRTLTPTCTHPRVV